jgi:hypothetical protein
MEWNEKGNATIALIPTFAATGREPNAAAMVGTSKCHPNSGDTRYAAPKQYTATQKSVSTPQSTDPNQVTLKRTHIALGQTTPRANTEGMDGGRVPPERVAPVILLNILSIHGI